MTTQSRPTSAVQPSISRAAASATAPTTTGIATISIGAAPERPTAIAATAASRITACSAAAARRGAGRASASAPKATNVRAAGAPRRRSRRPDRPRRRRWHARWRARCRSRGRCRSRVRCRSRARRCPVPVRECRTARDARDASRREHLAPHVARARRERRRSHADRLRALGQDAGRACDADAPGERATAVVAGGRSARHGGQRRRSVVGGGRRGRQGHAARAQVLEQEDQADRADQRGRKTMIGAVMGRPLNSCASTDSATTEICTRSSSGCCSRPAAARRTS